MPLYHSHDIILVCYVIVLVAKIDGLQCLKVSIAHLGSLREERWRTIERGQVRKTFFLSAFDI